MLDWLPSMVSQSSCPQFVAGIHPRSVIPSEAGIHPHSVIPAEAGIQVFSGNAGSPPETAGMTERGNRPPTKSPSLERSRTVSEKWKRSFYKLNKIPKYNTQFNSVFKRNRMLIFIADLSAQI